MPNTVYQLWRNLGPYHLVRAAAAAERLAAHGLDLVAVQIAHGEATRDWQIADGDDRGFQIVTLAGDRRLTLDRHTPSHWPRLRKMFENNPPAGVCLAGYDRAEMRGALDWCRRRGVPSVLMSETKWNDSPRPWWKQLVLRHLVGKAGAAQVSGSLAADFLHRLGMPAERTFQPYGVIDNALFANAASTAADSRCGENGQPYFLACCRLIESRKNLSTLFKAYADYRDSSESPWSLVVCGDGEDADLYRQQLDDLDIADDVRFVGFQQAEALAAFYAGAAAFVHPAREEAWGLVVNEAMAAGLPVLVSDTCGCAPDLVRDGENGFTFAPGDTDKLTTLLTRVAAMSNDQRTTMGGRSREMVEAWSPAAFGEAQLAALVAAGMELPAALEDTRSVAAIASRELLPSLAGG